MAKDNTGPESDIDLLVEPEINTTLFKLLELEDEISLLLNVKADVVEYSAIKALIKKEVLETAITIL